MAKRRTDLEMPLVESVCLELHFCGKTYLYGTFTRPPSPPISLWDQIERSFDLAYNTHIENIIIAGEFNVNQLKHTGHYPHLESIIQTYGLFQLINELTYYTDSS
jgi:hypothetical protein